MSNLEIFNLILCCLLILQSVAIFISARIINDLENKLKETKNNYEEN